MAIYKDPNDLVIREHFDIKDNETRKFLVSLTEDEKSTVVTALAGALYDKIVAKVDDIDFGSIPKTKGDITKVDGYDNTVECLDIIKKLVMEYKQDTEVVDTVIDAVNNIKQRKQLFMKGFALKVELPIILYNLTTLAIEHSISYLIAVCIDYVKTPGNQPIQMSIDRAAYTNAHDNMLFEQLRSFNQSCGDGQLDGCLNELMNKKAVKEDFEVRAYVAPVNDPQGQIPASGDFDIFRGNDDDDDQPVTIEPVIPEDNDPTISTEKANEDEEELYSEPSFDEPLEEGIVGTLVRGAIAIPKYALKTAAYLVKVIIPTIRNIAYFLTSTRVKISEGLALQAQLIELNAYNLKNDQDSTMDQDKRDKIAKKQTKIADTLKKWANKIAIDNKTSAKKAEDMAKEDEKKQTKEDIADQIPDEEGDVLF